MKKKIGLLVGVLLLIVLGWYSVNLIKGRGHSDEQFEKEQFAIKDTASIDKIIIRESNGMQFEVMRQGKTWVTANGDCIQVLLVNNILDAAYNARFKGYIQENAKKNVTNRMASSGTTVQFYVNGEWNKTWYIGSSTPDHMGTYMLLESEEFGKSEEPVIAELENMVGIIGPRFFAEPRKWACTQVFNYSISDIASVDVKFPGKSQNNFSVEANGTKFTVKNNGKVIQGLNDGFVTKYLSSFAKINYELPNYVLTQRQVDSVKASTPFCVMRVKSKAGKNEQLKMYRMKSDDGEEKTGNFGEALGKYDANHFWCVLPNGELVKCQYFVFDKITRGDIYFGFNRPN